MKRIENNNHFFIHTAIICVVMTLLSCNKGKEELKNTPTASKNELRFDQRRIVDDAEFYWAHAPADITGDGIADLVFIHRNSNGGFLGYYKGQKTDGLWELNIIAETPVTGGLFASGDMEVQDIDGDGDLDVFAAKHPGEWADASATAEVFWFENNSGNWKSHAIGEVPDAVKDVSFADFDNDGKLDMSILTFDEHTLSIFKQIGPDDWERVQFIQNEVLHEGMAVGDMNNDQFIDIVANGLVYFNPQGSLKNTWRMENLGAEWNNQEGDWSRNGTKIFARDVDGNGMNEIYMAHSERSGYPLVMYKRSDNAWEKTVIKDSIPANHTLQVFDFDLDGDFDVLAGINKGRAVNLNKTNFQVFLFLNQGDYKNYEEMIIESNGIYNGQAIDYDGDGDIDIFRYPDHESKEFFLMENKWIQ